MPNVYLQQDMVIKLEPNIWQSNSQSEHYCQIHFCIFGTSEVQNKRRHHEKDNISLGAVIMFDRSQQKEFWWVAQYSNWERKWLHKVNGKSWLNPFFRKEVLQWAHRHYTKWLQWLTISQTRSCPIPLNEASHARHHTDPLQGRLIGSTRSILQFHLWREK